MGGDLAAAQLAQDPASGVAAGRIHEHVPEEKDVDAVGGKTGELPDPGVELLHSGNYLAGPEAAARGSCSGRAALPSQAMFLPTGVLSSRNDVSGPAGLGVTESQPASTGRDRDRGDLAAGGREIVDSNSYMTLGTADAEGRPWVSPVWFAAVGYAELLWVSRGRPGTRATSRNGPS